MMIVVNTQYLENYSSDPAIPYWKAKGGFSYVIVNVPSNIESYLSIINSIEHSNDVSVEFATDWFVESDDAISQYESDHEIIDYNDLMELWSWKSSNERTIRD